MPHQCTECSRVFPDGSKEMLSGCPNCGGNKFQFRPKGSVPEPSEGAVTAGSDGQTTETSKPAQASGPTEPGKTRGTTLREWARRKVSPAAGSGTDSTGRGSTSASASGATASSNDRGTRQGAGRTGSPTGGRPDSTTTKLDTFARESDASTSDEQAPESTSTDVEDSAQADARRGVVREDELPEPPERPVEDRHREDPGSRPDLAQLREELNDQFESIKIVEPGQYELNLMELYDRDEYIIALQENGRYVIEVPDAWDANE